MRVERLDRLVLTLRNVKATSAFCERALGLRVATSRDGRRAMHFGQQYINHHLAGGEFEPNAAHLTSGSADLCFAMPPERVAAHL